MTLEVPKAYWRGQRADDDLAVESAVVMLADIAGLLGLPDLGATSMLDIGCGVKFSQAMLNRAVPSGRYVGLDVDRRITDFLAGAVTDPRFAYHHLDARNERYNPAGPALADVPELPVGGETFDVICLYSVFTHLDPADAVAMLRLMRPHLKPAGRLMFSIFLDETSSGGHGMMDHFAASMGPQAVGRTARYRDMDPARPLYRALYARSYAESLLDETGWVLESVEEPTRFVQHLMVCRLP